MAMFITLLVSQFKYSGTKLAANMSDVVALRTADSTAFTYDLERNSVFDSPRGVKHTRKRVQLTDRYIEGIRAHKPRTECRFGVLGGVVSSIRRRSLTSCPHR
jgi:hypothetical protein